MGVPAHGVPVLIVGFVFSFLAIATLGLRLWSRRLQGVALAFNDYAAILATILSVGTVIVCMIRRIPHSRTLAKQLIYITSEVFIGALGAHLAVIEATTPRILGFYFKLLLPEQLLWVAANTSVKLSILSLYTTIFPTKVFCRVCHATMGISVAFFIAVLFAGVFRCKPIQYTWDKFIPHGKCPNEITALVLFALFNLLIDAFIVCLAIPKVRALRMPRARRIAIGAMFSLGAIICVISLFRVISLVTLQVIDATYSTVTVTILSMLEPTLGVLNACLPVIRPAVGKLFKTTVLLSRSQRSLPSSNVSKPRERGHSTTSQHIRPQQVELLEAGLSAAPIHAEGNQQGDQV
ncbi:hypothetical protein F4861DRAFT_343501 [Xylaria intraflava]|nr:hypothetical protein F4861DRAFT_343501 [Xylaria intraflava]